MTPTALYFKKKVWECQYLASGQEPYWGSLSVGTDRVPGWTPQITLSVRVSPGYSPANQLYHYGLSFNCWAQPLSIVMPATITHWHGGEGGERNYIKLQISVFFVWITMQILDVLTYLAVEVRGRSVSHCVDNGSHSSHWPLVSHYSGKTETQQTAHCQPDGPGIICPFVPACSAATCRPIRGRGWVQWSWWRQPGLLDQHRQWLAGGGRQTGTDLPFVMIILWWGDGPTLTLPHTASHCLTLPHTAS